jgi:hypothetical protein
LSESEYGNLTFREIDLKAPHYPQRLLPLAMTEDLIRLLDSITGGNEDSLDTLYQFTKKTYFGFDFAYPAKSNRG